MKPLFRLVPCIMLAFVFIQLHAQVDVSVYPSKPVFDSLWYENLEDAAIQAAQSILPHGTQI